MIPTLKGFCETCIICDKHNEETGLCKLNGQPVRLKKDYCSWHKREARFCDMCNHIIPAAGILIRLDGDPNKIHLLCNKCYDELYTCASCREGKECKFMNQSYKPELPLYVQEEQRIDAGYIFRTVINKHRQEEICAKECKCWDMAQHYCRKQDNLPCKNYTCKI